MHVLAIHAPNRPRCIAPHLHISIYSFMPLKCNAAAFVATCQPVHNSALDDRFEIPFRSLHTFSTWASLCFSASSAAGVYAWLIPSRHHWICAQGQRSPLPSTGHSHASGPWLASHRRSRLGTTTSSGAAVAV